MSNVQDPTNVDIGEPAQNNALFGESKGKEGSGNTDEDQNNSSSEDSEAFLGAAADFAASGVQDDDTLAD